MNLAQILASVENKDDLIKQIETELGKEFVPRTEFNAKNAELKERDKQIGELNASLESLTKEKTSFDQTIADLNGKVSSYESASLKARIAHETGIPYELSGRLTGDDEASIRADALALSQLVSRKPNTPPLKSTEPDGSNQDASYKNLLYGIKEGE